MKRIIAFTIVFAMLFTAMLGIMPSAADETEPAKLEITRANVEFASTVYLLIEVDWASAGLNDGNSVKVDVTNAHAEKTTTLTPETIEGVAEGCVGFKYTDLSAKEMGDILTIKAYVNGEETLTDTVNYSILEYAVKAKATSDDENLVAAVKAMLDFGAAAEVAFGYTGDYDLYDDNSTNIGYGMVLVGGASDATRKTIAANGTTVTTAADSGIFKTETDPNGAAGYALYDMSFNEVASATAKEGITRYFYYGWDLYNCTLTSAKLSNNKTVYGYGNSSSLDLDQYTGVETKHDFYRSGSGYDKYNTFASIALGYNRKDDTSIKLTATGAITGFSVYDATFENGSYRPWAFRVSKATKATFLSMSEGTFSTLGQNGTYEGFGEGSDDVISSYLALNEGYLYLHTGESIDYGSNYITLYNRQEASFHFADFLVDGKMTISVSLAMESNDLGDDGILCYLGENYSPASSTKGRVDVFTITNNELKVEDTVVETVNDFDSKNPAFTTIHAVIDAYNGTVTIYTADGSSVTSNYVPNKVFNNSNLTITDLDYVALTCRGGTYLNRVSISKGSLFN